MNPIKNIMFKMALACLVFGLVSSANAEAKKPNLLIILTDVADCGMKNIVEQVCDGECLIHLPPDYERIKSNRRAEIQFEREALLKGGQSLEVLLT